MLLLHLESLMRLSNWQRSTSMEADGKKKENWGSFTESFVPKAEQLLCMNSPANKYRSKILVWSASAYAA